MLERTSLGCVLTAAVATLLLAAGGSEGKDDGPFAPSNLTTSSGELADPDVFFEAQDCGECHVTQYADWKGSLHSRAHHDALYLAFAEGKLEIATK